jgi:glycerol-3-phosphate dehydrogenase
MITFGNVTVDGCSTEFFDLLEESKQGGRNAAPRLHQALSCLVGIEVARARQGTDPVRLAAFRRDSAAALAPMADELQYFAEHLADQAELCTDVEEAGWSGWYDFCLRRSEVELLRDHYADLPAVQAILADDVERADRELRRIGAAQTEPLPARLVPDGMPSSHWWWGAPATARSG